MKKDPRIYLAKSLERAQLIEEFTGGQRTRFLGDRMVQEAVLHQLTIIGEAAKRIDEDYRSAHPDIPWRGLSGLRDVLVHQYEGVDAERVWDAIERDVPLVLSTIAELLPPLDQLERELARGDEDQG